MAESNFIHNIIDKDLETQKYGDKVHTRFPPEPNGYLHIGHAKSICLNFSTAEKYGGQCNLRYDDTNPVKEDVEYVDSIEEDVKWLGFQWDNRLWASDYFDEMYDCALDLIKKGKAYVCDLSADEIRAYRGTLKEPGKESPSRNRSVEENLKLFEEMREGKYADGEKVLRAKIDMASPNMNMRDPVIYRIAHISHHNTGDKWCIYPMYDFAHRGDHSFYLHAGIRRSQTALRLGPGNSRQVGSSASADRICTSEPDQYRYEQALPEGHGGRWYGRWMGRSADADHCGDPSQRLYAGSGARFL